MSIAPIKKSILSLFWLSLIFSQTATAENWHTFTDTKGRSFEGRVISVNKDFGRVVVKAKSSNKRTELDFRILSAADVEYLEDWEPGMSDTEDSDPADSGKANSDNGEIEGEISSRIYPKSKDEIRDRLKEIEKRDAPDGIDKEQQKTINQLNIYRYLSGVPDVVEADPEMVEQATDAAQACEKNGGLSHDLGHSTNICNLAGGSSMFNSVGQYINDGGDNNRENRGHRRWCLNPPMGKSGFGASGSYSAMVALDSSGKGSTKDSWAYPGKGFFPKEYMHGNGWSLYLTEKAPDKKDLKVEVYKLTSRPEKPFSITEEIPGRALPVEFVHTYENTINFEPEPEPITGRGIYWVRIKGGGVREGYLVELY